VHGRRAASCTRIWWPLFGQTARALTTTGLCGSFVCDPSPLPLLHASLSFPLFSLSPSSFPVPLPFPLFFSSPSFSTPLHFPLWCSSVALLQPSAPLGAYFRLAYTPAVDSPGGASFECDIEKCTIARPRIYCVLLYIRSASTSATYKTFEVTYLPLFPLKKLPRNYFRPLRLYACPPRARAFPWELSRCLDVTRATMHSAVAGGLLGQIVFDVATTHAIVPYPHPNQRADVLRVGWKRSRPKLIDG